MYHFFPIKNPYDTNNVNMITTKRYKSEDSTISYVLK